MQFAMAFKIIGVLLILFSSAMLPSLFLSLVSQDGIESAFAIGFGATLAAGILLWLPNRLLRRDLNIRDGFLVTALFWIVLGLFGAIPLWITPQLSLSPVAAIFESISGLTTTGATVITGLDALPQSILLYRQLLQWLGGIGIIVLAVAILPMLGIGGMQLYRAESAGPSKDRKLTPRITSTAKALFGIYLLLTVACALSYFAAGMSPFDALCHAFSTVAIGGFEKCCPKCFPSVFCKVLQHNMHATQSALQSASKPCTQHKALSKVLQQHMPSAQSALQNASKPCAQHKVLSKVLRQHMLSTQSALQSDSTPCTQCKGLSKVLQQHMH